MSGDPAGSAARARTSGERGLLERTFRLREHGTSVRIELLGGATTFATMAYIAVVGAVLEHTIRRIEKHLRRRGVLPGNEDDDLHGDPETGLAAAAVSGQVPPAGPQWTIRLRPPERRALAYDKPLCASDLRAEPVARPDEERAAAPKATAARSWMALHSTRPRAQARSTPLAARRCSDTCSARPLRRMRSSRARTAWSASSSKGPSPTGPPPP